MKTVVTGASGLLGANLVRALLDTGAKVVALVRQDTRSIGGLDVETHRIDILDPATIEGHFQGAQTVYHLAADVTLSATDKDGAIHKTNVDGTRNVASACRNAGVRRLVHFSSIHALRPPSGDAPVDETAGLARSGTAMAYDVTKALAEEVVLDAVRGGLDAVIVNPTAVLGPHDAKPSALGGVLRDLALGRMPALVRAGFDWVDARDVAAGAIFAAATGRTGERYLLGGHWAAFSDLAALVTRAGGAAPPRLSVSLPMAYAGVPLVALWAGLTGRPPMYTKAMLDTLSGHHLVDCTKSRRELGYAPRPLEETIRDTVAWFRDHASACSSQAFS